jgi:hypothetical protein
MSPERATTHSAMVSAMPASSGASDAMRLGCATLPISLAYRFSTALSRRLA